MRCSQKKSICVPTNHTCHAPSSNEGRTAPFRNEGRTAPSQTKVVPLHPETKVVPLRPQTNVVPLRPQKNVVPLQWLEPLDHTSWTIRAVKKFGKMRTCSRFWPQSLCTPQDENRKVRTAVVEALGRVDPTVLAGAWKRWSSSSRTISGKCETRRWRCSMSRRPSLCYAENVALLLQDDKWEVRDAAVAVLGYLDPTVLVSTRKTWLLLQDDKWEVRDAAVAVLGYLDPTVLVFTRKTWPCSSRTRTKSAIDGGDGARVSRTDRPRGRKSMTRSSRTTNELCERQRRWPAPSRIRMSPCGRRRKY